MGTVRSFHARPTLTVGSIQSFPLPPAMRARSLPLFFSFFLCILDFFFRILTSRALNTPASLSFQKKKKSISTLPQSIFGKLFLEVFKKTHSRAVWRKRFSMSAAECVLRAVWQSQTPSCPQKIVREGRPFYLCPPGPPVYRSIPHGFIYTGYLLLCLTDSILPLPRALSVSICVSPSLPSHMHVSFVHRTHVTHPCAARIAHCPPAGLVPRYRLDEFMSEVISIVPCSKPLS